MKALLVMSLLVAGNAFASPLYKDLAPQTSVRACVDQIDGQANYENAGRVRHEIESKERQVSGHTLTIDTMVFDADGDVLVRAYATKCAVASNQDVKAFDFRAKDIH